MFGREKKALWGEYFLAFQRVRVWVGESAEAARGYARIAPPDCLTDLIRDLSDRPPDVFQSALEFAANDSASAIVLIIDFDLLTVS